MTSTRDISEMACNSLVFVKAFHGLLGITNIKLLLGQGLRHRVEITLNLHMISKMNGGFFPIR